MMESTSDSVDESASLDFIFNSDFARSLSTDITKYDCDFSESVTKNSKDEEFLIEASAFFIENVNKSDEDKEKQLWNQNNKKTKSQISKNDDSSDAEILRLRKECQNLMEENRNRRLTNNYTHHTECTMQNNRLEMLQWQLTQAEKKNEMCIKLLREVAHFLEKCNTSFESSHHQQHLNEKIIERSKSISHISTEKYINNKTTLSNTPNRNRTHSISNLSHSMSTKIFTDLSFKDFTWRLSPKHKVEGNNSTISEIDDVFLSEATTTAASVVSEDIETEKLSKESYQMLRLIRNTINSMMTINNTSTSNSETPHHDTKLNFSELRSNTSGHLTISTSEKCDKHGGKSSSRFSAIENESGFSSMSSFIIPSSNINLNEIGIPASSSRKEVIFDQQQNENVENFNVLWV